MRCLKLLSAVFVTLVVAALLAPAGSAQVVKIAAAGSSAVFQATLDDASSLTICGANHWTKSSGGGLHDNRTGLKGTNIPDEFANVWITWDGAANGTGATVSCIYVAVDSGIGVRGYMANPRSTLFLNGAGLNGSLGDNLSLLAGDVSLPNNIFTLYGGTSPGTVVMNMAFSDVRPEDAQFQMARSLSTLSASRSGLGYGNWATPYNGPDAGCVGCSLQGTATIQSSYKAGEATTFVWYEVSPLQTDVLSGLPVQNWNTFPVGAVPILPVVNNHDNSATGLGSGLNPAIGAVGPWVAGPYGANNINRFQAGYIFDGSLIRTVDVLTNGDTLVKANCTALSAPGGTGVNDCSMTELQRETTSGTYTTWEFSIVRSHAVQGSQEDNLTSAMNPLNVQSANGSQRYRVLGTGEMVNAVCGPLVAPNGCGTKGTPIVNGGAVKNNRIGYAFWSYGNLKALRGNHNGGLGANYLAGGAPPLGHYLTVDGVDGLFTNSSDNPDGTLNPPICLALNCPAIPFTHLIDGSYSAWNIVRAIVPSTVSVGDGSVQDTLLAGLPATAVRYSDFLPVTSMHVFRSHRDANVVGINARNGNGCANVGGHGILDYGDDLGQDAGGAIFTIQNDLDYAFDFNGGVNNTCNGGAPADTGLVNQAQ
jgi:hypothetical protein